MGVYVASSISAKSNPVVTTLKIIAVVLCVFLLGSGCTALHIPQSEIVKFERGETRQRQDRGFSVTSGLYSDQIQSYAEDNLLRGDARREVASRNFWGISYTSLPGESKNGAVGVGLLSGVIGLDYTHAFIDKIYVTVQANAARNYDGFIQVPVYRTTTSGMGAGVFYRAERHGLLNDCSDSESILCSGSEIRVPFRVSAVGIRITYYSGNEITRRRIRLSAGYSPEVNGIVFLGGIGI